MAQRTRWSVFVGVLGVLVCGSAGAQPAVRLSSEFQVNTYTIDDQRYTGVAMDSSGAFVVVWNSRGQSEAYSEGVWARRFDAAGVALAVELQVDVYTSEDQNRPAVARDADGDFVVVWQSASQDGDDLGIFARRFNADGVPQASELRVNSYTSGKQEGPAVAMADNGDFVVAWESYGQDGNKDGIFARRFNSAGVPQASEFQVNSYTTDDQKYHSLDLDSNGDFVVAWESNGQDGFSQGIFARRFNSAGSPQAAEFQVSAFTADQRFRPGVGLDADGDLVITYEHNDNNFNGIFAQRFDSTGARLGVEFQVNTQTMGIQQRATVARDDDGGFVVVWQSYAQDGSNSGVFAQRFDAAGLLQGAETQVNSYTIGRQQNAALTVDGDGDFVIAWQSQYQDGDSDGVFAQRFATLAVLDADGNGTLGALTDGLLILRHLFGFSGTTLASGAVGAGCTRCTGGEISVYLVSIASQLDIDGSFALSPLTDGLLVLRFLFGFTGNTLTAGAVDDNQCNRCDAGSIVPYLQTLD